MNARGWMYVVACAASLAATMGGSPAAAAAKNAGYHIVRRDSIGGEGGWDLLTLESDTHRLFVGRSTRMQAIDVNSGKVLGEVPDTPGIHGIALAPDLGRGFTSNGRDSSVTEFDLSTLATIRKIKLDARNPDAIFYDAATRRVFTFNGGSDNATAIDATTGTVAGTVSLGGRPEFAVSDGQGEIFVTIEDSSAIVGFDPKTLEVRSRWPIAPGEEPSGLAIDPAHRRLFAGCSNQKLVVVDADSGRVVATLPIGKGVDATAFDPGTQLAFSSNGEGTLTVIHEDSPSQFKVVADVPTQRGARTMALDPKTHRIYLATARFGEPPPPTADHPHPRPPMIPGSFVILTLEK